jgi:carotenoid 1,2-hydratase
VPSDGYAWWYLDALSDDGQHGITLIAFIGSVFSPYYAWARRRGAADPTRHCAVNVALYGPSALWAMTERGAAALRRDRDHLTIGPSELRWDGDGLTVHINEYGSPIPRPIRGTIRLMPSAVESRTMALDPAGRHVWRPIAPCARVEVALTAPALYWAGPGYLDTNRGARPLEADFRRWDWSRARTADGALVQYDVESCVPSSDRRLAMRYRRTGGVEDIAPLPSRDLPLTGWRVRRRIGGVPGFEPKVIETLEDTPFYARSIIQTGFPDGPVTAMHESLSLDRFAAPWVQAMLPFRMPRAFWSMAKTG